MESASGEKAYSALLHKIGVMGLFVCPGIHIGILIFMWWRKRENLFIDFNGREVIRYQICVLLYTAVGVLFWSMLDSDMYSLFFSLAFCWGAIAYPLYAVYWAERGLPYAYPLTLSPRRAFVADYHRTLREHPIKP